MKKWMNYMAIVGLAAGTASAAWWPFGSDKKTEQAPAPAVQAPAAVPEATRMQRPEGKGERHMQLSPEQREKMRARHEELKKLGEAARNETDPAKKEVLISQLRTRLTEMADARQAEMKNRLEKAEQELPKLKEKLAEAEKNKADRIEKQVQRILSGEPIERPKGTLKEEGKKGPKPPVTE